jgi:hypothetical protein
MVHVQSCDDETITLQMEGGINLESYSQGFSLKIGGD